jgi:hypothetical protein
VFGVTMYTEEAIFVADLGPQRADRGGQLRVPGAVPPVATHSSEIQYLFDQPNAPVPGTLTRIRRCGSAQILSLVPPQPQIQTDFSARHHCSFWAAG